MLTDTAGYSYIFIPNPWTSFRFWRTYGALVGFLIPFCMLVLDYVIRDTAASGGVVPSVTNTLVMGIVAIITFIIMVVVVSYLAMCVATLGIIDFADCRDHVLCSGYKSDGSATGNKKPSAGALMMMIGWTLSILMALAHMILTVIMMVLVRRSQIKALLRRAGEGGLRFVNTSGGLIESDMDLMQNVAPGQQEIESE